MKAALRMLAVVAGVLVPTAFACAGIQVILVPPANAVPIRLEGGGEAKEATLYIPKALLAKARRVNDDDKKPRTAVWPSPLAAVMGMALALAVSGLGFLGLRNRPGGKGLALILALAAVLIAGRSPLQANAPVPFHSGPRRVSLSGGDVRVQVVDDGDTVRLVVPKSRLAEWAARLKAPEKSAP